MITLQASGRSESIQIPFVKAGVDYIWLTGSSLDKIDYLEKQTITKSALFPDELHDATQAVISFKTHAHKPIIISYPSQVNDYHLNALEQKITYGKNYKGYNDAIAYATATIGFDEEN